MGWEMVTLFAVIVPRLSGVPLALTHDPTARLLSAALTVCESVVEPVSVTVTVLVFALDLLFVWETCDFTVSC